MRNVMCFYQLSTAVLLIYTTEVLSQCPTPSQPAHGQYVWMKTECQEIRDDYIPVGLTVPRGCVLSYTCHEGYQFTSTAEEQVLNTVCFYDWSPPINEITCAKSNQTNSSTVTEDSEHMNSSDRTLTLTNISTGCVLPKDPEHRLFYPYNCSESTDVQSGCRFLRGFPEIQAIEVECIPGYILNGSRNSIVSVCLNQEWVPSLGECLKACPPLESDSLHIKCFYDGSEVSCKHPMRTRTTATYRCRTSHREYPDLSRAGVYSRTIVCTSRGRNSGQWSHTLPECEPICGVSGTNYSVTPTIVGGKETPVGMFPWHAGLYRRQGSTTQDWDYICGGTLISYRVVLTAAHCVALSRPPDIMVTLGKHNSSWSHQEPFAVRRGVDVIKVPSEYKGAATSYTWDVALLLMNESVQFNNFVMPVCRIVKLNFNLTKDTPAYVVGWGNTSPGQNQSQTLLYSTVSIMDDVECRRKTPIFLTFDKFCGVNSSVSVVQKGDSGGGLTMEVDGLHYVFGIVSIMWRDMSLFTNISWDTHRRWIDNEMLNLVL